MTHQFELHHGETLKELPFAAIFPVAEIQTTHDQAISAIEAKPTTLETRKNILESQLDSDKEKLLAHFLDHLSPEERRTYEQTFIDPETRLFNRNGLSLLDAMLKQENKIVTVAAFDGDNFGALNEVMGTEFGDFAIQIMAKHFFHISEKHGVHVVRMGGEEFTVFGEIAPSKMKIVMEELSQNIQHDLRAQISEEERQKIARTVFEKKYFAEGAKGLEKAYREIGGSTFGVLPTKTNLENTPFKNIPEYRNNFISLADETLVIGKNKEGRGRCYVSSLDPQKANERIRNFKMHNEMGHSQNEGLTQYGRELEKTIQGAFFKQAQQCRHELRLLSPFNRERLFQFFNSPYFRKHDVDTIIKTTGLTSVKLRELKEEYMRAKQVVGVEGNGAPTKQWFETTLKNNPDFSAENVQLCKFGAFKSVNELLGHNGGDIFLRGAYQAFLQGLKNFETETGINIFENILFAQKGADIMYVVKNNMQDIDQIPDLNPENGNIRAYSQLQSCIQSAYETFIEQFDQTLGEAETLPHNFSRSIDPKNTLLQVGDNLTDTRISWGSGNAANDPNFVPNLNSLIFEPRKAA